MKVYTEGGLKRLLEGVTIEIEVEKGDRILKDDYNGTFLVNSDGLCFRTLDCTLENYRKGKKIKANYFGPLPLKNIESPPWQIWPLR